MIDPDRDEKFCEAATRYGQLTIIEFLPQVKGKNRRVRVVCDCGKEKVTALCNLKTGHSVSCGCFGRAKAKAARLIHGRSRTKEYRAWQKIRNRIVRVFDCRPGPQWPNSNSATARPV